MEDKLKIQLAADLASLLPIFHNKFMHRIPFPIPPNHFLTLITLGNDGTQTITQLSRRLLMSKQQMSPIAEKLLNSGFVERTQDPADRRSVRISITDSGQKVLESYHEKTCNLLFEQLKYLAENDLEKLRYTLTDFFALLHKL